MRKAEIIEKLDIELRHAPEGKKFHKLGKQVLKTKVKSVLWYGDTFFATTEKRGFDHLFFRCVQKGKIDIPSDYDTCSKCGGSGNVGYNRDAGICYKCNGFGYKQKK